MGFIESNLFFFLKKLKLDYSQDPSLFPDFELNRDNGIISMKEGIKLDEEIKVSSYIYEGED